jgi:hypothetical protein
MSVENVNTIYLLVSFIRKMNNWYSDKLPVVAGMKVSACL